MVWDNFYTRALVSLTLMVSLQSGMGVFNVYEASKSWESCRKWYLITHFQSRRGFRPSSRVRDGQPSKHLQSKKHRNIKSAVETGATLVTTANSLSLNNINFIWIQMKMLDTTSESRWRWYIFLRLAGNQKELTSNTRKKKTFLKLHLLLLFLAIISRSKLSTIIECFSSITFKIYIKSILKN